MINKIGVEPHVKVEDNVGNSVVYASNGIVCEDTKPNISVVGLQTTETEVENVDFSNAKEFDTSTVYKDNIAYQVSVNDLTENSITSGLTSVVVEIFNEEITDQSEAILSKAGTITKTDGSLGSFGEESAKSVVTGIIPNTYNSDTLYLRVIAYDQAGNIGQTIIEQLKIDTTAPTIKMTSDEIENGAYYNTSKTMIVTYTERHFDTKLATFDIKVNGTEYENVSLDKLLDNKMCKKN